MEPAKYTLRIITVEDTPYNFINCDEKRVQKFRDSVFVRGCKVQLSPDVAEIISPFRIKSALIFKQKPDGTISDLS